MKIQFLLLGGQKSQRGLPSASQEILICNYQYKVVGYLGVARSGPRYCVLKVVQLLYCCILSLGFFTHLLYTLCMNM